MVRISNIRIIALDMQVVKNEYLPRSCEDWAETKSKPYKFRIIYNLLYIYIAKGHKNC